jgi:hypothetical protein
MAKYRLNRAGFREHLLNADWMVAEMDGRAQRAYEFALSISPVDEDGDVHYKDSFMIASGKNGPPDSDERDRAWAELSNVSPHAVYVEWGNGHDEGAHVMTKTLDALR